MEAQAAQNKIRCEGENKVEKIAAPTPRSDLAAAVRRKMSCSHGRSTVACGLDGERTGGGEVEGGEPQPAGRGGGVTRQWG